jgi:signal transduction histidine kinase
MSEPQAKGTVLRRVTGFGCLVVEVALATVALRVGLNNAVGDWTALDQAWVGVAIAAGIVAVGSGVRLLVRRPRAWSGPFAIGVGLTLTMWFTCNLSSSAWARVGATPLTTVFRVLLGALVLSWPIGRVSRTDRVALGVYAADLGIASVAYVLASPTLYNGSSNPLNIVAAPTLVQVMNQLLAVTLIPLWGGVLVVVVLRRTRRLPPAAHSLARPAMLAALVAGGSDITLFASDRLFADVAAVVSVGRWVDIGRFGVVPLLFALAAKRVEAPSGRVRTIDIGQRQTIDLRGALANGLGDPTVQLGFRRSDHSWVTPSGEPITLGGPGRSVTTVEHDRTVVAAIDHDPALDDRPSVVEAALATTALSLEHVRLEALALARLAEVQRVRLAIVNAEDVARHRLERDLHDGAQQRLVGLALQSRLVATAPESTDSELAALRRGIEEARDELRSVSVGALPALLADRGLQSALEALATTAPMTVDLVVRVPADVPAALAVTAWFVISEGVTNAVKHSGADRLSVRVGAGPTSLHVVVADDGAGGAEAAPGGGLAGLRWRVAAAGGTMSVSSPTGGGTTLLVELPFGGAA